jgi:non-canonical purine NTP pyrophosphatase (RdgB/HAM1 family)
VRTIVIATTNSHKVAEIRAVLGSDNRYLTLRDLDGVPPVEETGRTFADNARLKSNVVAAWLLDRSSNSTQTIPLPWAVLGDDSGLEVDALGGAPGVSSARYASPLLGLKGNAPDAANNARLLRDLSSIPEAGRQARFRCVLALTRVTERLPTEIFEGRCEGRIAFLPSGESGFGYDPLFIPEGMSQTFAALGEDTKNRISHRARALETLQGWMPNV